VCCGVLARPALAGVRSPRRTWLAGGCPASRARHHAPGTTRSASRARHHAPGIRCPAACTAMPADSARGRETAAGPGSPFQEKLPPAQMCIMQ